MLGTLEATIRINIQIRIITTRIRIREATGEIRIREIGGIKEIGTKTRTKEIGTRIKEALGETKVNKIGETISKVGDLIKIKVGVGVIKATKEVGIALRLQTILGDQVLKQICGAAVQTKEEDLGAVQTNMGIKIRTRTRAGGQATTKIVGVRGSIDEFF